MTLAEIQRSALELTDTQRATLAAELIDSLPRVLVDPDDGASEARRRSKELDQDPSSSCSSHDIRKPLDRYVMEVVFHRLVQRDARTALLYSKL